MRVNEEYDKNKLKLKNRPIIFTHTHTQCAVKTNKTYINLTSLSFRHHASELRLLSTLAHAVLCQIIVQARNRLLDSNPE